MECDLTEEDVVVPKTCPVLGIPLFVCNGCVGANSPTIDRIDHKGGYIKGNIIVVSHRANTIKSDATMDELELVSKFYRSLAVAVVCADQVSHDPPAPLFAAETREATV